MHNQIKILRFIAKCQCANIFKGFYPSNEFHNSCAKSQSAWFSLQATKLQMDDCWNNTNILSTVFSRINKSNYFLNATLVAHLLHRYSVGPLRKFNILIELLNTQKKKYNTKEKCTRLFCKRFFPNGNWCSFGVH